MATDPLPPTLLSDRVPQWWRPFTIDATSERMDSVRDRVERLRKALSLDDVVDAVAYAHGDRAAGERIIELIRLAGGQPGARYVASASDAEPPALCAAALADQLAVEPDSDTSTLVSLLILSARYGALEPVIEGMRLVDYAERQLDYRAASSRRMRRLGGTPSAVEFVEDALRSRDSGSQFRRGQDVPFAPLVGALAAGLDELAARGDAEHAIVREQLRLQAWAMQPWCATAEAEWSEVPRNARAIIAAIELAERTNGATPAIGADSLLAGVLDESGGRANALDMAEAVASAGPYLPDRLRSAPHPLLFPIATELARWRSVAGEQFDAGEAPAWRERTEPRDEIELGLQAYHEQLALRILGHD